MWFKLVTTYRYIILFLSSLFLVACIVLASIAAKKYFDVPEIKHEEVNVAIKPPSVSYDLLVKQLANEELNKSKPPVSDSAEKIDKIPVGLRRYIDDIRWDVRDYLAKTGRSKEQVEKYMGSFDDQLYDITLKFDQFQEEALVNLRDEMKRLVNDEVNQLNIKEKNPTGITFEKFFPWFLKQYNQELQKEKDRVKHEQEKQRESIRMQERAIEAQRDEAKLFATVSAGSFGAFMGLAILVALFGIEINTRGIDGDTKVLGTDPTPMDASTQGDSGNVVQQSANV